MRLRGLLVVAVVCCVPTAAVAKEKHTEIEKTVLRIDAPTITSLAAIPLGGGFALTGGTGFCLDPECRFICTNYHVAAKSRLPWIKRHWIVHRYYDTSSHDAGATANVSEMAPWESQVYVPGRDLAILELRHPLAHHHGLAYDSDEPELRQRVSIYGYPFEGSPVRGLVRFEATYKGRTTTGLLAFDYDPAEGKRIHGGASGGIVVDDSSGKIVGVLSSLGREGNVALAIPTKTLAEFVSRVQPFLAEKLFPAIAEGVPPVAPDFYPRWEPGRVDALQHRDAEPPEVVRLRSRADEQAEMMKNLIATQTVEWGSGNKEPAYREDYEVRIVDGRQTFRELPDGRKELGDIPSPPLNKYLNPSTDWSTNVLMVARRYSLKIRQMPGRSVDGQKIQVFQYVGSTEDNVCSLEATTNWGFFHSSYLETASCYGEVWTDQEGKLLRLSEHYDLKRNWRDFFGVTTYGPLRQAGPVQQTVPLTYYNEIWLGNKKYWSKGQFTNYQMFSTDHRLIRAQADTPDL